MTDHRLEIAIKELKEHMELLNAAEESMSALANAVTTLNNARHDGSPTTVIAAYNSAFNSCDNAAKVLSRIRNKLMTADEILNKL